MDGHTTYLDLPLERDYYTPRPKSTLKPPLRVLITDSGSRVSFCLIYKICWGEVFGPDQPVILHLANTKGVVDHQAVKIELEECGFPCLKDTVVSGDPSEVFKDVDVAIMLKPSLQESGISVKEVIVANLLKCRQIIRNVARYAKPDVKIIVAGSVTRSILFKMYAMHHFEPQIPTAHFSAVTMLDQAIAQAHLAARLRTLTTKIKNLLIWGISYPDVTNATVWMKVPGDLGGKEEEVPVTEALQDDHWLKDEFVDLINQRVIEVELQQHGVSVAAATARHLQALFRGTPPATYVSMGVLTPEGSPYLIAATIPFSYPVCCKDGLWTIQEKVPISTRTFCLFMQTMHELEMDLSGSRRVIERIKEMEEEGDQMDQYGKYEELERMVYQPTWRSPYLLSPLPGQAHTKDGTPFEKTTIAFDDTLPALHAEKRNPIRFSVDVTAVNSGTLSSILKKGEEPERLLAFQNLTSDNKIKK